MLDITPFQRACAFVRRELADGPRPGHEIVSTADQVGYGHALVLLAARQVATASESDGHLIWRLKQESVSGRESEAGALELEAVGGR